MDLHLILWQLICESVSIEIFFPQRCNSVTAALRQRSTSDFPLQEPLERALDDRLGFA